MEQTFGEWLRAERGRLDVTQQELAEATRMAVSSIGAIEQGRVKRPRRTTRRLIEQSLVMLAKQHDRR